ncbi:hypothetical protein EDD85DRAFT_142229 [Armillaria nabsnona]|nr:hypothetical protein EDD85DRAFT_142229 [Armillaria nabsnona]
MAVDGIMPCSDISMRYVYDSTAGWRIGSACGACSILAPAILTPQIVFLATPAFVAFISAYMIPPIPSLVQRGTSIQFSRLET